MKKVKFSKLILRIATPLPNIDDMTQRNKIADKSTILNMVTLPRIKIKVDDTMPQTVSFAPKLKQTND